MKNLFTPGMYKIVGESLTSSGSWISESEYELELANFLCSEMNFHQMENKQAMRYSVMAVKGSTMPVEEIVAKSRYPKNKIAEKRLQRLLDAVELKKGV